MTSTRQVRDYFCHTMQQVENRTGDHTFHELFDTWLNEVKAEAWTEGFDKGFYRGQILHGDYDASEAGIENPYEVG